ncbi:hypothetical protein EDB83DRAFT_2376716 [Lactarius deliciosus]|nr:hypothetical protein EDB83DRAFT_2376716 [Lactarius deliciosus]
MWYAPWCLWISGPGDPCRGLTHARCVSRAIDQEVFVRPGRPHDLLPRQTESQGTLVGRRSYSSLRTSWSCAWISLLTTTRSRCAQPWLAHTARCAIISRLRLGVHARAYTEGNSWCARTVRRRSSAQQRHRLRAITPSRAQSATLSAIALTA